MAGLIFVTGAPRSGTGLLADRMAAGPGRRCIPQPVPLVLSGLKQAFLTRRAAPGQPTAYPLSDQQFATYTSPDEFTSYLEKAIPTREDWTRWLDSMDGYSGQYTRPATPLSGVEAMLGQPPLEAFSRYLIANYKTPGAVKSIVWKETFAEEFVPGLLAAGHHCLIIVRDPRDSIASQFAGRGEQFVGGPRPLLFVCRQWRKSALFALAMSGTPGFHTVRFESLARNPVSTLCDGLPPEIAPDADEIGAADGTPRNSSFSDTSVGSTQTIGRHKTHLSAKTNAFIEAICAAEMSALGYETSLTPGERKITIERGFQDAENGRAELSHYLWNESRRDEELSRLNAIQRPDCGFLPKAFLFERAYDRLRTAGNTR
ncbi:hypothetical protein [Maricaulis sp.]|uniref:hypothetical protein n=1 Tax=Maricaulis sp. TaxID=1486257 RepID=UPI003A8D9A0B